MSDPEGALPLTIVVPTRDRPEMLRRCLESIQKSFRDGDELIVVDSASEKADAEATALEFGARYIADPIPGAGRARNLGWKAASHEIVGFVDDDITVAPDWTDTIRSVFADRPDLGFVTGKVIPPADQAGQEHPIAVVDAPDAFDHQPRTARHQGISGNFGARREVLLSLGGFDEMLGPGAHFKGGGDDFDLFDRMIAAGAPGRYEPSILAFHDQWRSKKERLKVDYGYAVGSGARLSKLMRSDRAHARALTRELFWRWGLKDLGTSIKDRYEYAALAAVLRLIGFVRGFAEGITIPVVDGHFVPRRRHTKG
ncbi:MAG: glycosyltransferase family 2 protein [Actinomycetota bacterium]